MITDDEWQRIAPVIDARTEAKTREVEELTTVEELESIEPGDAHVAKFGAHTDHLIVIVGMERKQICDHMERRIYQSTCAVDGLSWLWGHVFGECP